ncbi:DUF6143 family protein [Clostridium drakei]|uniref:Uncharacterized protein n=1 Tax=Clostridium drakei TaxID=332101 RepID=A0A2U8DTI9_9CLOT|nr:DUF6143 family protein [Clostridium drakei]AWI05402.1 hypothetical protein B9W14_13120 [Clostridium drakei]
MRNNITSHSLREVVTIENPIFKSFEGKYFIGESDLLSFGFNNYAWGALYNPKDSGVNLYFSVTTVTNTSDLPIKSQIYLNSTIPEGATKVTSVTPSNLTILPPPKPKIIFLTGQFLNNKIEGGVKAFTRIVPPNFTLVNEENGKIVIPPGGNILNLLISSAQVLIKAHIAYGFWREEI